MLVRIWKTQFDAAQKQKLLDYAHHVSLPVLSTREGARGVMFFSSGNQWTTMTLWDDQASIDKLDGDAEYQPIVAGIEALGVLGDEHSVDVFDYDGGSLPMFVDGAMKRAGTDL